MLFDNLVEHHIYRGIERPISARAYDYVLAGNGLFKRSRSDHIQARIPVTTHHVAGLPDLEPEIDLSIWPGRVPGRLLYPVLADAQRHARNGQEQMYQLRLATTSDGLLWQAVLPDQRASGGKVSYQAGNSNATICDLHSHHQMAAFFSDTDDRDEMGYRFYAVVGRVLSERPEILLRLGMYGDFCYLPATTLFTDPGPFADQFYELGEGVPR